MDILRKNTKKLTIHKTFDKNIAFCVNPVLIDEAKISYVRTRVFINIA